MAASVKVGQNIWYFQVYTHRLQHIYEKYIQFQSYTLHL